MRMLTVVVVSVLFLNAIAYAQEAGQDRPTPQAVASEDVVNDRVPKVTKDKPMSFWMAHKLDYSKTILESLTMGDYEELATVSEQMRLLGKIEGFVRRKNSAYRIQLQTFDLAAQELVRNAKRENAAGATLAFNQMTASCVACHELLRKGID